MIPFRKTLGCRLLSITFILLVIPLLVDSFIFLKSRYDGQIMQATGDLEELLAMRTLPFETLQEDVDKMFSMFLYFFKFDDHISPTEELDAKLRNIVKMNGYYGMLIAEITKERTYQSISSNLPSYQNKDVTEEFSNSSPFSAEARRVGYTLSFREKPFPLLIQTRGIYSSDGVPLGFISLFLDMKDKLTELLQPDPATFSAKFALLLPSNEIFSASDSSLEGETLQLRERPGVSYMFFPWQGKEQVAEIAPLAGTPYRLMIYAPKESLFTPPLYKLIIHWSSYVVIFIVGFILAYLGTKRLSKPLQDLSIVMHSIEMGDTSPRYKSDFLGFEINRLGKIFNTMIDTLLEKKKNAEQERVMKETYSRELLLGQKVQRSLLPETLPQIKGLQISHAFVPAIQVGGDFYDVDLKDNGTLLLAIADASGKGVRACCYSLNLKNIIRTLSQKSDDVALISQMANNLFYLDTADSGMFVTAIVAKYFPETKEISYYSSGHNPPLFFSKKERKATSLEFLDMAMGVIEKQEMKKEGRLALQRGDLLLFYSDGVTEAHNEHGEMFGEEKLIHFMEKKAELSAQEFIKQLLEEIQNFAGEAKQHDDITMLIMKVL